MTTVERTKAALLRDPEIPAGQRSPLHIRCGCGTDLALPFALVEPSAVESCAKCGLKWRSDGWRAA